MLQRHIVKDVKEVSAALVELRPIVEKMLLAEIVPFTNFSDPLLQSELLQIPGDFSFILAVVSKTKPELSLMELRKEFSILLPLDIPARIAITLKKLLCEMHKKGISAKSKEAKECYHKFLNMGVLFAQMSTQEFEKEYLIATQELAQEADQILEHVSPERDRYFRKEMYSELVDFFDQIGVLNTYEEGRVLRVIDWLPLEIISILKGDDASKKTRIMQRTSTVIFFEEMQQISLGKFSSEEQRKEMFIACLSEENICQKIANILDGMPSEKLQQCFEELAGKDFDAGEIYTLMNNPDALVCYAMFMIKDEELGSWLTEEKKQIILSLNLRSAILPAEFLAELKGSEDQQQSEALKKLYCIASLCNLKFGITLSYESCRSSEDFYHMLIAFFDDIMKKQLLTRGEFGNFYYYNKHAFFTKFFNIINEMEFYEFYDLLEPKMETLLDLIGCAEGGQWGFLAIKTETAGIALKKMAATTEKIVAMLNTLSTRICRNIIFGGDSFTDQYRLLKLLDLDISVADESIIGALFMPKSWELTGLFFNPARRPSDYKIWLRKIFSTPEKLFEALKVPDGFYSKEGKQGRYETDSFTQTQRELLQCLGEEHVSSLLRAANRELAIKMILNSPILAVAYADTTEASISKNEVERIVADAYCYKYYDGSLVTLKSRFTLFKSASSASTSQARQVICEPDQTHFCEPDQTHSNSMRKFNEESIFSIFKM